MSDAAIPKEQLTAYERWEFPNLDTTEKSVRPKPDASPQEETPDIVLPTTAQLEEIMRQAHDEGYQAGYAEGSQRIATLLKSMQDAMQHADQEIAQDLLKLSLEVARQMVHQTLKTNPEILLNTIREAIASLPHFNQGAHLILHPDDATILRTNMGEQLAHSGWKIFEDASIERGGTRIETAHSQIDATLANRWKRIVASIGQDSSWILE